MVLQEFPDDVGCFIIAFLTPFEQGHLRSCSKGVAAAIDRSGFWAMVEGTSKALRVLADVVKRSKRVRQAMSRSLRLIRGEMAGVTRVLHALGSWPASAAMIIEPRTVGDVSDAFKNPRGLYVRRPGTEGLRDALCFVSAASLSASSLQRLAACTSLRRLQVAHSNESVHSIVDWTSFLPALAPRLRVLSLGSSAAWVLARLFTPGFLPSLEALTVAHPAVERTVAMPGMGADLSLAPAPAHPADVAFGARVRAACPALRDLALRGVASDAFLLGFFLPELAGTPSAVRAAARLAAPWRGTQEARVPAHVAPGEARLDLAAALDEAAAAAEAGRVPPAAALLSSLFAGAGGEQSLPEVAGAVVDAAAPGRRPALRSLVATCVGPAAALWLRLASPRGLERLALGAELLVDEGDAAAGVADAPTAPSWALPVLPSLSLALGGCLTSPRALHVLLGRAAGQGADPARGPAELQLLNARPAGAAAAAALLAGARPAGAPSFVDLAIGPTERWQLPVAPAAPPARRFPELPCGTDLYVPLYQQRLCDVGAGAPSVDDCLAARLQRARLPVMLSESAMWARYRRADALPWHAARGWWLSLRRGIDPAVDDAVAARDACVRAAVAEGAADVAIAPTQAPSAAAMIAACGTSASRAAAMALGDPRWAAICGGDRISLVATVDAPPSPADGNAIIDALLSRPRPSARHVFLWFISEGDQDDEDAAEGASGGASAGAGAAPGAAAGGGAPSADGVPRTAALLPAVRRVALVGCGVTDAGLARVAAAAPSAEVLRIVSRHVTTAGVLRAVARPARPADGPQTEEVAAALREVMREAVVGWMEGEDDDDCPLMGLLRAAVSVRPRLAQLVALCVNGARGVQWPAMLLGMVWQALTVATRRVGTPAARAAWPYPELLKVSFEGTSAHDTFAKGTMFLRMVPKDLTGSPYFAEDLFTGGNTIVAAFADYLAKVCAGEAPPPFPDVENTNEVLAGFAGRLRSANDKPLRQVRSHVAM